MIPSPSLSLRVALSLLALAACSESTDPTPPRTAGDPSSEIPSFDLARNGWTNRARLPDSDIIPRGGLAAGVVNNAAGQPILYALGGFFEDHTHSAILAYDYSRNAWTTKASSLELSYSNGVGRIGGKLYISGGYLGGREGFCCDATKRTLYAYDPVADRLIRKADMPRQTAEGSSTASFTCSPALVRMTSRLFSTATWRATDGCSTATTPPPIHGPPWVRRRTLTQGAREESSTAGSMLPEAGTGGSMSMIRRRTPGGRAPICPRLGAGPALCCKTSST